MLQRFDIASFCCAIDKFQTHRSDKLERIKVKEIAEVMNMSKERVCHILNQHVGMRKLSARWVPRFLTVDQKRIRMNISNALLAQFRRNESEF